MAGRPRARNLEETIKRAKEFFAQGLTQIEVTSKLEFNSVATFRKYLNYHGRSITELMG